MMSNTKTSFIALAVAFLLFGVPALARSSQPSAPPAATSVTRIELTFKRDPRMVDPFRGIGEWVTGSNYSGATAQEKVEVRAEGVSATGKPIKISPEWSTSDPEIVSVSPTQGDDVMITVHKAGESKFKVTYQGLSKELVVKAQYVGKFMLFEISPPAPAKPNGPAAEINPALKDHKKQIGYAAGMRLAETLRQQSVEADPEMVMQAMNDVMSGGPTLMSDDQVRAALMTVETELNVTAATVERRKIAEQNKKASEQFLAHNKNKEGVVTLPDGLQYRVLKAGDGKSPTLLDAAVCHYKGTLVDGTEFDNSYKGKTGAPVTFPVKAVIKGWQEALKLMPAGSKWEIVVPPDLAYGERGMPRAKIPPNAALIFEVELLSVKELGKQAPPAAASAENSLTPEQMDAVKKALQTAGKTEAEKEAEKNQ